MGATEAEDIIQKYCIQIIHKCLCIHSQMEQLSCNNSASSGIYQMVRKQSDLIVNVLDAGKMGSTEDLSDFDKGHIFLAR